MSTQSCDRCGVHNDARTDRCDVFGGTRLAPTFVRELRVNPSSPCSAIEPYDEAVDD